MSTEPTTGLTLRGELEDCIGRLERGELTVQHLRQLADGIDQGRPRNRQDIMYMQTLFSSVTSKVNGMALIENGQVVHCPEDPEDWPYESVLDAINDGWRIISFPNQALMMDNAQTYGMGCEFILEKLR